MALTDSDRRRFLMATALTLVALPALWWANQDDGAPNVATAGIAVDDTPTGNPPTSRGDDDGAGSVAVSGTLTAPSGPAPAPAQPAPATAADDAPVFLEGPAGQVGAGLPEIAVPTAPAGDRFTAKATFRSSVGPTTACAIPGMLNGATITVVNLDNNRSITCTTVVAFNGSAPELVMHPDLFAQIADLTDAPIPVEIHR
jgi:hypothetical protein